MRQKKRDTQFLAILLLLAVLTGILGIFIGRYHYIEREMCVTRLQEYTETCCTQVSDTMAHSQDYLSKVSGQIYQQFQISEDNGRNALATMGDMGVISRLELLMPDGTLYTSLGKSSDPTLSFRLLSTQGEHITHRTLDQQSPNQYIIRMCSPVRQQGKTVAILCGIVELDRLTFLFPVSAYDGHTKLYLLECDTGNYIIDSKNTVPGNLRSFRSCTFARGYSPEQFYQSVHAGESGVTVLRLPQSSGNYYLNYGPTGIPNWTAMLVVPESAAFSHSNTLLLLFGVMSALVVVLFSVFLLWFLRDARRRQQRSEKQLKGVQYILEVQQILFRAHTQSSRFQEALEKIADYLVADATFYYTLEADGQLLRRSVGGTADTAPPRTTDLCALFPQITKSALTNGVFMDSHPGLWGGKDKQSARSLGIRNMMLVRLDTSDGKGVVGVLGAINYDILWEDPAPLEQVALIFAMATENYKNHQTLAYLSQVDELTRLMNRNSYQTRLEELERVTNSLTCVYVDVNGLHEINNHLGHDAGDEMLRSVANALRSVFDRKDVFRLGGDEFAVLTLDLPATELDRRMEKAVAAIEKCGYSVSVGTARQEGDTPAGVVVAQAEKAMRDNKADYYAHQGGERQMRQLNARLEQTLTAKRDADILLSYLAPTFRGVYFVNPSKDSCRSIVIPPLFEQYLKESDGRFSAAMSLYIQEYVCPEDQERFRKFCRYDVLLPALKTSGEQEIFYRKKDGSAFLLRIREPRRAGDDLQEIMWLFTQVHSDPE